MPSANIGRSIFISIPTPVKGVTLASKPIRYLFFISIPTPVKGVTARSIGVERVKLFQFPPP